MFESRRDGTVIRYGKEMCRTKHTVETNHRYHTSSMVVHLRLDHPHPSLLTWCIANRDEPRDEGTGVRTHVDLEGEKEKNTNDAQPLEPG